MSIIIVDCNTQTHVLKVEVDNFEVKFGNQLVDLGLLLNLAANFSAL